jgi:hypothetical protein
VRSRLFMTTVLTGLVGAIGSGASTVTLRFDVKRGLSLRCWIFGHEDWVRRVPGRLYLECVDCGRETQGWTTSRNQSDHAATSARAQVTSNPKRPGVFFCDLALGRSAEEH